MSVKVSAVIPVFNEEKNLDELVSRLTKTLEGAGFSYEIVFVDDGSRDASLSLLKDFAAKDPRVVVVEFTRNFGQHAAVMAGFAQSRGEVVVTLDADLQNPPEEIPKLVARMAEGYDTVGGWRRDRDDSVFRKMPSRVLNSLSAQLFGVALKDYGCMLRAYSREVVDEVVKCPEVNTYIPALANSFARRVTEIPVEHAARTRGESKYNLVKLLRLNFDLMTGFSLLPIQAVGLAGITVAIFGLAFAVFLFIRRLVVGPEAQGVFTLFAILFFFIGLQIFALGVLGEYIGRIYQEVRRRPRFVVRGVHGGTK
ncbi:MAG: glycosyltransferase [Elusimicrobiales bacterium]|nr:glycosyltransferase [Elusimicrobiales bacterium]